MTQVCIYNRYFGLSHLHRRRIVHRHHAVAVDARFSLYHGRPVVQLPHLVVVHAPLPAAVPRGVHPAALLATVTHKYRIFRLFTFTLMRFTFTFNAFTFTFNAFTFTFDVFTFTCVF